MCNYLTHFLGLLQRLGQSGSIQAAEALGCSNIIRKIMLFFPPSILVTLDSQILGQFLQQITQLTCHFLKATTQKDRVGFHGFFIVEKIIEYFI